MRGEQGWKKGGDIVKKFVAPKATEISLPKAACEVSAW